MLAGMILAIVLYFPIYIGMKAAANPLNLVALGILLWLQLLFTTMVNGPQQAFLAESFSARVRTTSTGTIFNVANGFIAGFLPFGAFWLSSVTGNPYMGLAYLFCRAGSDRQCSIPARNLQDQDLG